MLTGPLIAWKADNDCMTELPWIDAQRSIKEARQDLASWLRKWGRNIRSFAEIDRRNYRVHARHAIQLLKFRQAAVSHSASPVRRRNKDRLNDLGNGSRLATFCIRKRNRSRITFLAAARFTSVTGQAEA